MQKKHTKVLVLVLLGVALIYRYGPRMFDTNKPTVVATVPKNYAQGVPVDIKCLKFIFSENMKVPFSTGRVGKELPIGTITWEDTKRTILSVPVKGPLPYQTSYTFVLNPDDTLRALTGNPGFKSMRDLANNELSPFFFTFKTERDPASEKVMNKLALNALFDTDKDGLEDELELAIGTHPAQVDTDADGLSDYDEHCKYKTDATKADSDGDGKIDGDWDERREYTYTIRAICEINDPVDLEDMNDLFQDVRVIAEQTPTSHTRYEIILYPDSQPHLLPTKFPYSERFPLAIERYTQGSFATNFSSEMQEEVQRMISGCRSDLEVIERIQLEMAQMRLVYEGAVFLYCRVEDGNRLVMTRNPIEDLKPENQEVFLTVEQLLDGVFYGDSMFTSRRHGVCDSRATLRATMLKAAGIPTRLTLAVPMIYSSKEEAEKLVRSLTRESVQAGYVFSKSSASEPIGVINHSYTEVYVNNKWIRLDQDLNEGLRLNNKHVYLKIISFADWSEVDFTRSWSREKWSTHRPYKTVELSDAFPNR